MTQPGADHLQDERTHARIREALDQNLFVEAGAGTGKTRALVERLLALVLNARPIERIVAITFTEKAAAELRDRVREALEEAAPDIPEQSAMVQQALGALDRAQISTIHSFCQTLLRSFAAEAGIDPSFGIQDQVLAERRLQDRWRLYLDRLGGDVDAVTAIDRALGLGMTPRDLETLARDLTQRLDLSCRLAERPLAAPVPFWPNLEGMRRHLADLPLGSAAPDDELRRRVDSLIALVESLFTAKEERESVLAAGSSLLEKNFSRAGNADAWGGTASIRLVRETAGDICQRLKETLAACRSQALADVMPLIVGFVQSDAAERGREGTLTFDDLILRVRELLRDSPDAVRVLRVRYDSLLIDEFQDTDPLQVEIALAFATDPSNGGLEPGRLFLVGDPKQSIYRFRQADMAVYSRTRDLIERYGGEFPALSHSRRSRSVILDWVNSVFAQIIGPGDVPAVQPPYHPIYAHREDNLEGAGVGWFGRETPSLLAREIRQTESQAIAAQCQAVADQGWQVMDRDGVARPASFGDIAVLIPARTALAPLERALADAGIPYRVEGGSLIYRTQEVRDLLNCLTAIDDPADEVAVVGALRSPAFACSDVQLARHRAAGGGFNYLSQDLETREGAVAEAMRVLAQYHNTRHERSLAALVEDFVASRGLVEIGILDQGDRNSFRRMRFVAQQARAFEAAAPESLRAFVQWLERRSSEVMLDNEGAGLDDDEDAVRIMTIHGAKGLEFPIVIMAGLASAPYNRSGAYLVDYASDRVGVSIGAKSRYSRFELGPVEELNEIATLHAEAEYARLLYVAATRARDHLLFSLYHRSKSCAARRLIEAGATSGIDARPEPPAPERAAIRPFAGLTVELPDVLTVEEFEAKRRQLVEASRRKRYTSATALGGFKKEETADAGEPWARGRGGTRLGRAVHAAIQSLPLDAGEEMIRAFSQAQAVAEAIPGRAGEVAQLVGRALRSQAAVRARAAPRALREVPFAVEFDGVVLEGFLDLLIETPGGFEIVDWKTDQIAPQKVAERLRDYELQAGLYVLGIESATQRSVISVTYVFASAGVETSPGQPSQLAQMARAQLAKDA